MWWSQAAEEAGLGWIGPPHDLRHGGASRDVELQTRSLEHVRRRGRWSVMSSVQRYTKTWLLVRERSKMTNTQLLKAQELLEARPKRCISAMDDELAGEPTA
jgi:hypothetical protein